MTSIFTRQRHPDRIVYIVLVLWLTGHTLRAIAAAAGLRTKQVSGIVGNSEYRNRADMSDRERLAKLLELKAIRFENHTALDAGALDRIDWKLRPLGARQARGPLRRKVQRHG